MKLYYAAGACSLVVRIILEELKIAADFEAVDLKTKKTETGKNFLEINPKGSVPVLQLDDGTLLTENAVILQYLADSQNAYALLPGLDVFKRYRVLEWLNYITTELHKSFGALFNSEVPQALKEELFIPLLKKKFAYVDAQLKGNTFLLGEHFTLPDAYLFVMLTWAKHLKLGLENLKELERYDTLLRQRPAIVRALKAEARKK